MVNPAARMVAPLVEEEPISPLHAMLARVGREHHAQRLNRIVNDQSVYRWVRGYATGKLDLSAEVVNPANVLLMGEHGGVLFHQIQPGLYEAHCQVLKGGRGKWAVSLAHATAHWMFCRTEAMELVSRCPQNNLAARALTERSGARRWMVNPAGWVTDLDPVPTDIYSLTIHEWMKTAPGLVERGQWFYRRLGEEYRRHGKKPEMPALTEDYHRYIGAAVEMFLGEQIAKGVVFYGRFAAMAGLAPIRIVGQSPIALAVGEAIIVVRDGDFYIASV